MFRLLIACLLHFEFIAVPGSVSNGLSVCGGTFSEANALLDAEQLGFVGVPVVFDPEFCVAGIGRQGFAEAILPGFTIDSCLGKGMTDGRRQSASPCGLRPNPTGTGRF